MVKCSIKQCSVRYSKKQPQISVHRFPKGEFLRKRWLDAIGKENINPCHKNWLVCSLHFEEKCLNKTLGVVRLSENAIPSLFLENKPAVLRRQDATFMPQSLNSMNEPSVSGRQDATFVPQSTKTMVEKIEKLKKTCEAQKKTIKKLNEKVRRRNKTIASLAQVLEELQKKKYVNTEQALLLEECAGSQDFLKRQVSKSKGIPLEKKYSEEIRKFALTLHFYSPKAYNFIRNKYATCLPHTRTLRNWYKHIDAEPGFTEESFVALKTKADQNGHPLICALVMDEMAIRTGLGKWDPGAQKYWGRVTRVDIGTNTSGSTDSQEEAKQVLVLLLNSIDDSWKLPIGYFLVTSLTGEQKSGLIQTAIHLCEDVNVKIVSLTCDGPVTNFSMYCALGCNLYKNPEETVFKVSDSKVYAFIDPCHCIKLIRNALGDIGVFYDHIGRKIDFSYFEKLLELQDIEGLHMATKITKAHILFGPQKMKVRLATQLFSNSVADAMEYCRTNLALKQFEGCEGTVNFIHIIDNVFDVLNSHSIRPPGWKKAMHQGNIGLIRALFDAATEYIKGLLLPTGERLIDSGRRTGFLGYIICMNSALGLYNDLVGNNILKYIPLYKVSQDHVELFFSAIRARGGFNNNPNAIQFRAAYKRMLIRHEIRDGGLGNCIPLQQINILTVSSKNPVENINMLTEKSKLVDIPEDHSDLFDEYSDFINEESSEYSKSVTEYIAGFIAKKNIENMKCHICMSLLYGEENVKSLIFAKTRGGLRYASNDVINIVRKCEKLTKHQLNKTAVRAENYYLYIFTFLIEFYETENIFLAENNEHDTNHRLMLIKCVIKAYLDLRYRYHSKKSVEKKVSKRNFFNKLVLFRNE